jgi:hypothetical protein
LASIYAAPTINRRFDGFGSARRRASSGTRGLSQQSRPCQHVRVGVNPQIAGVTTADMWPRSAMASGGDRGEWELAGPILQHDAFHPTEFIVCRVDGMAQPKVALCGETVASGKVLARGAWSYRAAKLKLNAKEAADRTGAEFDSATAGEWHAAGFTLLQCSALACGSFHASGGRPRVGCRHQRTEVRAAKRGGAGLYP